MRGIHCQAHHLSSVQINDRGNVDNFLPKIHMGKIGGPDMVGVGRVGVHEQVRVNNLNILSFFPLSASPAIRLNAEDMHDPFDGFVVALERQGNAWRAV